MAPSSNAFPIPWLSLCALALCVGASLWAQQTSAPARHMIETSLADAAAYYAEHPDTIPGQLLSDHLGQVEPPEQNHEGGMSRLTARRQKTLDDILAPAERSLARLPVQRFGLHADRPSLTGLLSYPLFHAADAQLMLAAFLLLALGIYLEPTLGRAGLGLALLGGGLGAGAGYLQAAPLGAAPMFGATGCLAGAVAAHVVRNGRDATEGRQSAVLFIMLTAILGPPLIDRTWLLAPPLADPTPLGIDVTGLILLGGMVGGVLGMLLAATVGLTQSSASSPQATNHSVRRALEARASGRSREAFDLLARVVKQQPSDMDAVAALWDVAGDVGRRSQVHGPMLSLVREQARRGELEIAARYWLELAETGVPVAAEAALLVKLAAYLQQLERPDAAVAALEAALDRPGGQEPALAARVARLAETLDPATAEKAAWRALASPELGLSDRQELERVLGEVVEPASVWVEKRARQDAGGNSAMKAPIDIELSERSAEALAAIPVSLGDDEIVLELASGKRGLGLRRIEAIAVAVVGDQGAKPVVIIDLVLNWMSTSEETLRLVRLRSDQFDPRSLVDDESATAGDAVRIFLAELAELSRAHPLPDAPSVVGQPFAHYDTLEDYQRTVLMVDSLKN